MSARLPDGMTPEHWARLQKLTDEQRDRVLERATLIFCGNPGMSWKDADEAALLEVGPVQRTLEVGL